VANSNYYKAECEKLKKQNAQLTRIIDSMTKELVVLRTIKSTIEAMSGQKIETGEQVSITAASAIIALQEASRKIDWERLLKSEEYASMLNIGPTMNL
jgi:uncharacterized protein (UPF0147 family)